MPVLRARVFVCKIAERDEWRSDCRQNAPITITALCKNNQTSFSSQMKHPLNPRCLTGGKTPSGLKIICHRHKAITLNTPVCVCVLVHLHFILPGDCSRKHIDSPAEQFPLHILIWAAILWKSVTLCNASHILCFLSPTQWMAKKSHKCCTLWHSAAKITAVTVNGIFACVVAFIYNIQPHAASFTVYSLYNTTKVNA